MVFLRLEDLKKFEDECLLPKILVKKINGISSFAFKHFELFGKEYKIMFCGTLHNYCYNKTFCEEPCLDKDNCTDLIRLIVEYAKHNCIDVFTETRLDDRLKNFQYARLGSRELPETRKDINKMFDISINEILKHNYFGYFRKENGEEYNHEELAKLSIDEYIITFQQVCSFREELLTELTLRKIYNYLYGSSEIFFTEEEKSNFLKYINFSIENELNNILQTKVPNVRHHLWDIRTIHSKTKVYTSPIFFLPEILKNDMIINVNKDIEKFNTYSRFIKGLYGYSGHKNIHELYSKILSLLCYLTGYNTGESQYFYMRGKNFYNDMFEKFELYYKEEIQEINFDKEENIRIFSELISKQIEKSIFSDNKILLYEILARCISHIILKNEYNPYMSEDDKKKSFYYNFEVGLYFSDIYSICRMFKKQFDPKKHQKGNICDELDYFKNIIYVGGGLHFEVIYNFIDILKEYVMKFNEIYSIPQVFPKNKKIRCIEFEEPIEIF